MVFPVGMYGCESWTIQKAEHWGIDAFELWYWRRLWRVPWTARRSNQSTVKEINPEYSLEGLMLKLFQYFDHRKWRAHSLEKTLMLEKIEGRRRRGWQRTRWLDGVIDSMDMSLSKLISNPCDYQFSIIIYCRDCSFFVDYLGTCIKINGSCTCGSTSGLSCLFHWSILLPVPRCLDHSFDYLVSK